MSKRLRLEAFLLLVVVFLGFYTLGCTGGQKEEQREDKLQLRQSLGIIISNVSYSKAIREGDTLYIYLRMQNVGDSDANNVRVYLEGLSTKWKPPTPIERTIVTFPRNEKIDIDFSTVSPTVGENMSYPLSFRVEYDYKVTYNLILEVVKEEREVKVKVKSESNSIAPLAFNITEVRYDSSANRVKLKLILINRENGRVIGDALIKPEDLICDSTRLSFSMDQKTSSRELNCDITLPKDFTSYYPQARLESSFRYSYKSKEYTVKVNRS